MVSQQLVDIIIKAEDQASAAANKVDQSLQKIGESSSKLSRIPGFDTLKTKITGVASTISGKFSTAVDGVRSKLQSLSNGAKGLESAMGFLKGAVSMTAGMIGFELVNALTQAGRAAINARAQLDYFAGRLNMSASEVSTFKDQIADLQKEFRKVDMTAVGATAEEIAVKMDLPKNKLADLTRMTAVLSSTFVKEGRSQEDAVLAVGDALDGQFKRLQEIGITQDKLKQNGWSGELSDQAGLIDALNKTMKEMGYEQTAKDITSLDEAFTALSVAGGNLLAEILIPITPALITIMEAAISAMDAIKPFIQTLQGAWNALPDWLKDTAWAAALVIGLYAIGTVIMSTVVPALAAAAVAAIDFAIAMMANPLTWVLVAIVAITLAIYELGKAFGWWDDVSGMWDAFLNNVLMPVWEFLVNTFTPAWNFIGQVINAVMPFINALSQAFNSFKSGQMDLPGFIMTVMTNLFNIYKTIWSMIIQLVITVATQLVTRARLMAMAFVTNIITRIKLLPGQMLSALLGVVRSIVSAGQQWISNAKSKASSLVSNVVSTLSSLPGKVGSALAGVVDAIVKPFRDAYNQAKEYWDKISSLGGILGGDFAGYDMGGPVAGYDLGTNTETLDINYNISLDLSGVPSGMNTTDLITALTDKTVLSALTGNRDFQNLDAKVKARIASKQGRARGV